MSSHKVHYDACPLGHENLSTTARYTRVSTQLIGNTASPLDRLSLNVTPPG
jgi:integrase/recombinase XerD